MNEREFPGSVRAGTWQDTDLGKIVAKSKTAKLTNQIVTAVAKGTDAQVTLWGKIDGVWKQIFTASGFVGKEGIGHASEGSLRTPMGSYPLGFAFGKANPGTKLPFRQITKSSYWISDVNSDLYNTWQEGDFAENGNEHLAEYEDLQYYYAIVIHYNTDLRVKGAGSAFFFHVSNGQPTAGCVAMPKPDMEKFMQLIRPGAYIINVRDPKDVANF